MNSSTSAEKKFVQQKDSYELRLELTKDSKKTPQLRIELVNLEEGDKFILEVTQMFIKEIGRSVQIKVGSSELLYDILANNFKTLSFEANGRISFDYSLEIDGETSQKRYSVQTNREKDIRKADIRPPTPSFIQKNVEKNEELTKSNERISVLQTEVRRLQQDHKKYQGIRDNAEKEVKLLKNQTALQDQKTQQIQSQLGLLKQAIESNQSYKLSNLKNEKESAVELAGSSPKKYATVKLTVKSHSFNGNKYEEKQEVYLHKEEPKSQQNPMITYQSPQQNLWLNNPANHLKSGKPNINQTQEVGLIRENTYEKGNSTFEEINNPYEQNEHNSIRPLELQAFTPELQTAKQGERLQQIPHQQWKNWDSFTAYAPAYQIDRNKAKRTFCQEPYQIISNAFPSSGVHFVRFRLGDKNRGEVSLGLITNNRRDYERSCGAINYETLSYKIKGGKQGSANEGGIFMNREVVANGSNELFIPNGGELQMEVGMETQTVTFTNLFNGERKVVPLSSNFAGKQLHIYAVIFIKGDSVALL